MGRPKKINTFISCPNKDFSFLVLTRGQVSIVDNDDIDKIKGYGWYANYTSHNRQYQTTANISLDNGNKRKLYLSRIIMDALDGVEVDHINHNRLDNRKSNLRLCNRRENLCNRPANSSNTSGYKGVVFHKRDKKWQASIRTKKGRIHLGYFNSAIEAATAYNQAALKYHKEFACLNDLSAVNYGGKEYMRKA